MAENRRVALGSDHVGYELKQAVAVWLREHGWEPVDVGAGDVARADYPIYGEAAARKVASGDCRFGVAICGTGVGIGLAANKVRGIRCVTCSEPFSAALARRHNDANMLSFGARVVGPGLALLLVESFLGASFEGGRHQQRVDMLSDIEARERGER